MAVKSLDSLSAFSPGCDLWIIGPAAESKWARKIDWHLNFQIRRADLHQTPALSSDLKKVIEESEAVIPDVPAVSGRPLMIASSALLPNSKTVLVAGGAMGGDWVMECHKVWSDLGRPLTRVFLPDGLTSEQFSRSWPNQEAGAGSVEVVVEPGAHLAE